ncbi:choice-of-anchor Q domain-containing protein [Nocardioides sp.]|uniref:choice-of-anchor Q domain-containing protein n=1 Tax=Nocardioides sp. TaxID=35761 RepID=UPI003527D590
MFNIFTEVPLPSRLRGLIIDDINFSGNPKHTAYGEKLPAEFVPIGIYDYTNRLVTTVESDFNGFYDVLLPSTNQINCPTPSGICAGMYRFVGNDPGVPGALNPNYNPRYRVIATEFEAVPGVTIPTDLAPTQVGAQIRGPVTGQVVPVECPVDNAVPQLFAVNQPYVNGSGDFVIEGLGFGANQGAGSVTLDGVELPVTSWSDTSISVSVPSGAATGPQQLLVTADNGNVTRNGLTFHVLGGSYNPNVLEVGNEGSSFATIQDALNQARSQNSGNGYLVVVYPGVPDLANPRMNPLGAYYENLIMASPVKLQGVGPGGFQGSDYVPGTILDAGAFGGDTDHATAWYNLLGTLNWDGNQTVNDGQGIYVLARSGGGGGGGGNARQFTSGFKASIDGFDIRGGDQRGFPGNINELTGAPSGLPANISTQGGAIFANSYARYLQVTNNVIQNNGGAYGAIRLGTPDLTGAAADGQNENIRISHNRIVNNAGTNLAGAIGVFAGADNYEIDHNDVCGNFTLEYGGGISVYGRSPNGRIHHNAVYLNQANDEGGGIMIAGALPANPDDLSPGSGSVSIDHNQIKANMSNDDGGGIRFLMAGSAAMNVNDNVIADNVSTHEGGGISLNDASNVRIVNNTIMKNLTTATAVTSNGSPAPAGLSTSLNSDQLQATLPSGSPLFSNPVLFNNIFWDNRAGTRAGGTVQGLGLGGATDVEHWDLGVADPTDPGQVLAPTYSVIQDDNGGHDYAADASNVGSDPAVADALDVSVSFTAWRQNPAFVDATLVTVDAPVSQLGDYHLTAGSPAIDAGTPAVGAVTAPDTDLDDGLRPADGGFDIGADEFGAGVAPPPAAPHDFTFSTVGNGTVPGLSGPYDDADLYSFESEVFGKIWDAQDHALPGGADVDGYAAVDATHFYLSFAADTAVPGLGTVGDEDVVYYDDGTWVMWFDGSASGLTDAAFDIDAIAIDGQTLYFSLRANNPGPPGAAAPYNNGDVYRYDGGIGANASYTKVVDLSTLGVGNGLNVDGLRFLSATHFWVSLSNNTDQNVPGVGLVADEDIVEYDNGTWSSWFDGSAYGLDAQAAQDIDAFSFGGDAGARPPTVSPLVFSTVGSTSPDGILTAPDNADVYTWDGSAFGRAFDATALGLPASANLDGLDYVDGTHFYASFDNNTSVPGLGTVQDEDVVFYNDGAWELFFDGTANGLTQAGEDVDGIWVLDDNTLFFSTVGNISPPGVGGNADNSDIYRWARGTNGVNGSFNRAWDATAHGVPGAVNVDGLVRNGPSSNNSWLVSFSNNTGVTLPGIGLQDDEDVLMVVANSWSIYFDGSTHGLGGSADLDVDAFDIP